MSDLRSTSNVADFARSLTEFIGADIEMEIDNDYHEGGSIEISLQVSTDNLHSH